MPFTRIGSQSQAASVIKNLPANAGATRDIGLIPGSGRSPGGGNGNPLQYSCQENPMDRGAWRSTGHGVAKSQTRLSDWAQPSFSRVVRGMDPPRSLRPVRALPLLGRGWGQPPLEHEASRKSRATLTRCEFWQEEGREGIGLGWAINHVELPNPKISLPGF